MQMLNTVFNRGLIDFIILMLLFSDCTALKGVSLNDSVRKIAPNFVICEKNIIFFRNIA